MQDSTSIMRNGLRENSGSLKDTVAVLPDSLISDISALESDDLWALVQKLGVVILIGLLIGLEREHSRSEDESTFAGIRTYPLISMFGFTAALVASFTSIWVFAVSFLAFSSLVVISHAYSAKKGNLGGTSEIAAMLVFILGSMVYWNLMLLAGVVAVLITMFLTLKLQLHKFVGKLGPEDLYATVKLAIISVIVLPLLPDTTIGPLNVLNPRLLWLMVIFISAISFIGYILIKFAGRDKGVPVTGLMGGMVSSTAVAFSFSRKSKKIPGLSENFAVGLLLASTVMYPRVFIVASVLNGSLAKVLWLPMLLFTAAGAAVSWVMSKKLSKRGHEDVEIKNPFELKSALIFGAVFGAVMFASKAAEVYLGSSGIYAASALAGLTSVDAIVLSLAELSSGGLDEKITLAAIIIAASMNTIVKAVIAAVLGTKEMKKYTFIGLGILTAVSLLYLGYILFLT